MKSLVTSLITNKAIVFIVFSLLCFFITIQAITTSNNTLGPEGQQYTKFNNYKIFAESHSHLIDGKNLYAAHPDDHYDIFKYTPTFAIFFGIISNCPDTLGLFIWNMLNILILLISIYSLSRISLIQKGLICLIIAPELITSVQNEQSNALIAGLIILAFTFMENKKYLWSSLFLSITVFVKLFGGLGFVLLLFHPNKLKHIGYSAMWIVLLSVIPLVAINSEDYFLQIKSFFEMLRTDHDQSLGYSLLGILDVWFNLGQYKFEILFSGVLLFLLKLIRISQYSNYHYRLLILASILIWVIIFNHKAESPSYIIAITGVAIWFMHESKTRVIVLLFILAIIFSSLSATDLFPGYLRESIIIPYMIKPFPIVLIWFKIWYDVIFKEHNEKEIIA